MTGAIIASVPVVSMELSYLIIAMMDEEPTVVFGRSVSYVKVMGLAPFLPGCVETCTTPSVRLDVAFFSNSCFAFAL